MPSWTGWLRTGNPKARSERFAVAAYFSGSTSVCSSSGSFAPRITTIKIPVDKIRDVIGPGGKMIRSIIERTGVKIDVEDDGRVNVASADGDATPSAPADAVQRWSTDKRSRVPALPRLDGSLPRCRQTVHRGAAVHG